MEDFESIEKQEQARARRRAMIRKKRRRQVYLARFLIFLILILSLGGTFLLIRRSVRQRTGNEYALSMPGEKKIREMLEPTKRVYIAPPVSARLIRPNEFSRSGESLPEVKNIFIHYTANPGTGADQNRDYFDGLAESQITSASAHFVVGLEGEIVQCLPLDEIGYAVKGRNYDSISIECCYLDESGQFPDATYQSLIELCAYLLGRYELNEFDLMRHYDEGGKLCPKYYVEHPEAWDKLIYDVGQYIHDHGTKEKPEYASDGGIIASDPVSIDTDKEAAEDEENEQ